MQAAWLRGKTGDGTSAPHHLRALPITLQTFFQTIQLDSQNTQNEGPNCLDGYIFWKK